MLLSGILMWTMCMYFQKNVYWLNNANEKYFGNIKIINYQRENMKHYKEVFPVSECDCVDCKQIF